MTSADLIAKQERQLARIKRFARLVDDLERRGLARRYLARLAADGPSTLPQVEAIARRRQK